VLFIEQIAHGHERLMKQSVYWKAPYAAAIALEERGEKFG
jgi:hypothetical protein